MSNSLRYRNPKICDHLASQYVAGTMTSRVRTRMDTLITTTPELEMAVAFWADSMAGIDYEMPETQVSKDHWAGIESRLPSTAQQKTSHTTSTTQHWWQKLVFWQVSSLLGMATSLALAVILALSPTPPSDLVAPNYMAAMSAHNDKTGAIRFVVNAYTKTDTAPSRLVVQWSEREPRRSTQALHIWAEDKDTGELSYVGVEPETGSPWHLQKPQWQAVANSSRLLATTSTDVPTIETTLFSGPCVQLTEWRASS